MILGIVARFLAISKNFVEIIIFPFIPVHWTCPAILDNLPVNPRQSIELTVSATLRDFILISAVAEERPAGIPRIIQFSPSKDALSIALGAVGERIAKWPDVSIVLIELIPALLGSRHDCGL